MAGEASDAGWKNRIDRAGRWLDTRIGPWPAWLKLLVFAPLLVVLTAALFETLFAIHAALAAIQAHLARG